MPTFDAPSNNASANLAGKGDSAAVADHTNDPVTLELDRRSAALCDESGVDISQIDRMLSLTPRERLTTLAEYTKSIARFSPHAPRD